MVQARERVRRGLAIVATVVLVALVGLVPAPTPVAAQAPDDSGSGATAVPAYDQVAVGATGDLACALRADQGLTCWAESPGGPTTLSGGISESLLPCVEPCVHTSEPFPIPFEISYGPSGAGRRPPDARFTDLDVQGRRMCAVRVDQTAACFSLGNGEPEPDPDGPTPLPPYLGGEVVPVDHITEVALELDRTCYLRVDGTLTCWSQPDEEVFAPEGTYLHIDGGRLFSCGVKTDATLRCWGRDGSGQATPPPGSFTDVATGATHACALRTDGTAACWGQDSYGQSTPPSGTFASVSAGNRASCGIRDDGTLACWGSTTGWSATPTGTFSSVAVGDDGACATATDGALRCWGQPSERLLHPELDLGEHAMSDDARCVVSVAGEIGCTGAGPVATAVEPPGPHHGISIGSDTACALDAADEAICWGALAGTTLAPPPGAWDSIAVGDRHACGVRPDQSLECWGDDTDGAASPPPGSFVAVDVGAASGCGIAVGGALECWGSSTTTPPAGSFTDVSLDNDEVCVLGSDGVATCWLDGGAPEPAPAGIGPFSEIAVTDVGVCAIEVDGDVACWASNYPEGISKPRPGNFERLTSGGSSFCARRVEDGVRQCFGRHGELDGAAINPGPSSLSGTVLEDGTDAPLPGISVRLLTDANVPVATRTTAADGSFSFAGVAPGPYLLRFVDADGSHLSELHTDAATWFEATVVPVPTATDVVVEGHLAPSVVPGALGGTVREDGSGAPLAGISVRLLSTTNAVQAITSTAADGTYAFIDVVPGSYLVRFVDLSGAHLGEFAVDAAAWTAATPTAVTGGATAVVDASLQPIGGPGAIDGTVTSDDGGAALGGIEVRLLTAGGAFLAVTTTGADGTWAFGDVDPGTYLVRFIDGTAVHVGEFHVDAPDRFSATGVVVSTGVTTTVDAGLAPYAEPVYTGLLRLRVREDVSQVVVPGVTVRLLSTSQVLLAVRTTNSNGYALFRELPPGSYVLRVVDPSGTYLSEYHLDATTFATATAVSVGSNTTTVTSSIALAP